MNMASDLADEVPDLSLDKILNVPVIYAAAKVGRASLEQPADGSAPDNEDLEPLTRGHHRAHPGADVQPERCPAGARHQYGRPPRSSTALALLRIYNGTLRKGRPLYGRAPTAS